MSMDKGQEKTIKLKPSEAYGDPNPQLVKKIPKDKLPPGQEVKAGMILGVGLANGAQIPAKVVEVSETLVWVKIEQFPAALVLQDAILQLVKKVILKTRG